MREAGNREVSFPAFPHSACAAPRGMLGVVVRGLGAAAEPYRGLSPLSTHSRRPDPKFVIELGRGG